MGWVTWGGETSREKVLNYTQPMLSQLTSSRVYKKKVENRLQKSVSSIIFRLTSTSDFGFGSAPSSSNNDKYVHNILLLLHLHDFVQ